MKIAHKIAWILVIVGGLNWLLVGLGAWFGSNWNLVNMIFGSMMWLESLVYVLVGVSAIILIIDHRNTCKHCEPSAPSSSPM